MRVLVAPDKFKGFLPAPAVAAHIATGLRRALGPTAEIDLCPLSDGGEGFTEAILSAGAGERRTSRVHGPLADEKVAAAWGLLRHGDETIAVLEMAAAAGFALVPEAQRDPRRTTTFGVGELLLAAAAAGATRILIGLGGSATIDAGLGCCQAAGATILRRDGEPVSPTEPLFGRDLADIYSIKRGRGSRLERLPITIACDVRSPLHGPNGAALVYGPQKGATPELAAWFDAQHRALAERCFAEAEAAKPGAGAAGGLGWALHTFFAGELVEGFKVVSEAVGLQERIEQADLVLTGEGRFDTSSTHGKVAVEVAKLCRSARAGQGVPCALLAGQVESDPTDWFTTAAEVSPPGTPWTEILHRGTKMLEVAAERIASGAQSLSRDERCRT